MISEHIRMARLAAGLTRDQVATALTNQGIPLKEQTLSEYETGKQTPNAMLMLKLAKILNVNASYFVAEPDIEIEDLTPDTEQVTAQPLTARALLNLPKAERERLMNEAFDRAADLDIEFEDQYSEADFEQS
jgi:transcriptional regulator with XRE-family HTH domain